MGRLNDQFRSRIKTIREDRKLRQKEVGTALGVTQAQVSNIEAGRSVASLDQVELFATYFGVPIGELLAEVLPAAALEERPSGRLGAIEDADELALLDAWRQGGARGVMGWVLPHIKNREKQP